MPQTLKLTAVEKSGRERDLRFRPSRMFNGGLAGSDPNEVAKHIYELKAIGIPPPNRVRSAIDLAKANFSNTLGLREELDEARTALRERKIIERAKGIIMRERGLSEDEAYASLRNRAMQRGVRLIVVAEMINEAAEVMQL